MAQTLLVRDVDVQKLTYGVPKEFGNGKGKFAYLNYEGRNGILHVQTPNIRLPYGISSFPREDGNGNDLSVEIPTSDPPTDKDVKILYDKFTEIDEAVLRAAAANAADWDLKPNSKKTLETYRGQQKGTLIRDKRNNDKKIVCKIDPKDNITVIDKITGAQDLGLDYVTRGSVVKLVLAIPYVWLIGGAFGTKLSLKKVLVMKKAESGGSGADFVDDPSDEPTTVEFLPDETPEEF